MANPVDQFNKMADFITGRLTGEALEVPQPSEDFEEAKQDLIERMKEVQSRLVNHRFLCDSLAQAAEVKRGELVAAVTHLEEVRNQFWARIDEAKQRNQALLEERKQEAKTQQELKDQKWTAASDIDKIASANTAISYSWGGST